jgi:hypothetical protein
MSTQGLDPGNTTLQAIDQYLCTRVPIASPNSRAGDIRRALVGQDWEVTADVAICDGDRLVGLLEMEKLLAAPEDRSAAALMDSDPPVVAPGLDREKAAWKMVEHGESSLAVVDSRGRFLGLVPSKRLLGVLLAEHEEDMARMGAFCGVPRWPGPPARKAWDAGSGTGCPGFCWDCWARWWPPT